jgi:hypothetical protein
MKQNWMPVISHPPAARYALLQIGSEDRHLKIV